MADRVQAFLLFCEDFRVEDGSKPMFIGVLSPVFYTSLNPGVSDKVYIVTAVTVPPGVNEVELKLDVAISIFEKPDEKETYRQTLQRPEELGSDDTWSVYIPLPIIVPEWRNGTEVKARLKANDCDFNTSLRARIEEDGDLASPSAEEKPPRLPKSKSRKIR